MSSALLARRALLAPAAVAAAAPSTRAARVAPVAAKKGEVLHIEVRMHVSECTRWRCRTKQKKTPTRERTNEGAIGGVENKEKGVVFFFLCFAFACLFFFRGEKNLSRPPTNNEQTTTTDSHASQFPFVPLLTHRNSPLLQVQVGEEEAPEMAVKRFRRSAGNANVVMEVRKFLAQEERKRKQKTTTTTKTSRRFSIFFSLSVSFSPSVLLLRPPFFSLSLFPSLSTHTQKKKQAKRRRQFENSQDKAKRKDKEVRMRRSKRYQYQATTAEDSAAAGGGPGALEPAPFAEFFSPAADAFVGSLAGSRE